MYAGRVNTAMWQILILVGGHFTEKSSVGDFFTSKYPLKATFFTGKKSHREECAIQLYRRF